MNDDLVQAYARLSAHEFLLEELYANFLASTRRTFQSVCSRIPNADEIRLRCDRRRAGSSGNFWHTGGAGFSRNDRAVS
jgi:hypothetical protein